MAKSARVLTIAGSDSGGGAGIQADIKTITALGGYAASAITALTAQNTQGVFGIHEVPTDFLAQQITLVLEDIGADAIKTGMLHNAEVIFTVCDTIRGYGKNVPLVVDPVMVAKGGSPLLQRDAVAALHTHLIPLAKVITPNIPEAELLCGRPISSVDDMHNAAEKLLTLGCEAVLLKGGHLHGGDEVTDIALWNGGKKIYTHPRLDTPHTHGTGCTLASAIATGLAQGMLLEDAIERARAYVYQAILHAPAIGTGHGPLGHGHTVRPFSV